MTPVELVENALQDLERHVTLTEEPGAVTHVAIKASGIEHSAASTALGRYLTGALAGIVQMDATLSTQLMGSTPDARQELVRHVHSLVGATNIFTSAAEIQFRDTVRNAWIGEGVGHAMFLLRSRRDTLCLAGTVRAMVLMHPRPSRQGLDLIAIYEDAEGPAVAIGEAKTSRDNGSGQLTDAASFFGDVDNGVHSVDIRNSLAALRGFVAPALAARVSDTLWRERSAYVPMIVHEQAFSPTADRPALGRLRPPVHCRRVIVFRLDRYGEFFDAVSDSMRGAVGEVFS